jgi:hypothetical protein
MLAIFAMSVVFLSQSSDVLPPGLSKTGGIHLALAFGHQGLQSLSQNMNSCTWHMACLAFNPLGNLSPKDSGHVWGSLPILMLKALQSVQKCSIQGREDMTETAFQIFMFPNIFPWGAK